MLIYVKNNDFAEKMQKNVKNFVGGEFYIYLPRKTENCFLETIRSVTCCFFYCSKEL